MQFKLGFFDWKIKFLKYMLMTDEGKTYGDTCDEDKVIRISKIDNNQVLRETLMHEILHACMEDEDINGDLEERVVRRLSPNLMQVLGKKEIRDFLFKEEE